MNEPGLSWIYRELLRPALFKISPEEIHDRTVQALGWLAGRKWGGDLLASFFSAPPLPVDLLGLHFPNPIGLAAGMDKDATALPAWAGLGFGFVEVGSVTFHPQPGNPPPRLFRASADQALINRMGFNNPGAAAVAERLIQWKAKGLWPRHPVGINLGKSKIVPLDSAAEDYRKSFELLWPQADFFVVNVSSPNTPQLRQLQERRALEEILVELDAANRARAREPRDRSAGAARDGRPSGLKPILVKVAPDLSWEALDEILELALERNVAGLVATNTTVERPGAGDAALGRVYAEAGGLSGRPLRARSTEIIRHICRRCGPGLPVIGVGGIFTGDDAWEKISAGAALLQVYTGLVYQGPTLARDLVVGLRKKLARLEGSGSGEAVGAARRESSISP